MRKSDTSTMKPAQRTDSASQSCSCTSCLYKSESEQLSIRKYTAHGSRIDRLYYGKYIPLRERKLLNRLVRTRAVYDDLRARLISDSTLSLDKNADLRPRKHHHAIKTLNDTEKSGAILELVDIIDKGAVSAPKKLSECCSCCSCSSKAKILESDNKEHRYKRSYSRRFETKYGHRGQYGQRMQGRIGERHNKRGVRFRAKHVRSDPCTCTFKFSGLIKKHSKAMMQKIHPVPMLPIHTLEDREMMEESKLQNFARKSHQKYKGLQEKLEQDMRKLNESAANMKQNLQVRTKKSLERIKQAKDKLKTNIESGVRKSVEAVKGLQRKDKAFENLEYPEDETNFKIKKDSIVKFKDYLKRKEITKDWECDLECVPDICEPEECFRILKLRRLHKRNRHRDRKQTVKYETFNQGVNIGEAPLRKSSSSVQAEQFSTTAATHMRKQKPMLRGEGGNEIMGQRLIFETKEIRKEIRQGVKQGGKEKTNLQQIVVEKSEESPPMATAREGEFIQNVKNRRDIRRQRGVKGRDSHILKKDKSDSRSRQAVRIGSSLSFDMGFYKNKPDSNTSNHSSHPSGIHLTDNKIRLYAHKFKHKKVHGPHKGSQVILKPSLEAPQHALKEFKIHPKRYDAKFIQANQYGEIPIAKRVSSTKTNTGNETKSVSSFTKNPVARADKNVAMGVKKKELFSQVAHQDATVNERPASRTQAVRIESKFSFNVEFYKQDNLNAVNVRKGNQNEVPSIKEKVKNTRNIRSYVPPKVLKNKGSLAKAKYIQAKTTLMKCICTLKSQKNKKIKTRIKTSTTGTVTSIITKTEIHPSTINKLVETKKRNRLELSKTYQLLPYECEPGVCVPGECDPIICKQLLDQRNSKLKTYNRGAYTSSRQTRSASSIVSRPFAVRTKNVQSSVISTKLGKTNAPRRYKENFTLDQNKENKPGRQAVRIGSSFSFNIEFYKDKQIPTIETDEDISNLPAEIKYKKPKLKEGGYQEYNKNNKSMFAQVINMDQNIGPSLKRCFCTLKLYKNKNIKKKGTKRGRMLTANTQTFGEMVPVIETVDRGTKTKWKHNYELLPYECEPYFCVPGDCDPYVCLERIKKRQLNVRDYGVFTSKPKVTSISSFTENSYTKSTGILAHPKLFRKGTYIKENYNKALDDRPREAIALTGGSGETYDPIKSKQAVRIGSSFNISIEFSKQFPQELVLSKQPKREKVSKLNKKMYRNKSNKVTNIRVGHLDVDTQSLEPRKVHRSSLVRPMLKRCFCTLNLQKKTKQQYRKGQYGWTPGNQYFMPKMYTVSRAMTPKTGITSHHNFGSQYAKMPVIESNKMISISTSSFLFRKYVTTSVSTYSSLKLYPVLEVPVRLKQPLKINSDLSVDVEFIREFKLNKESEIDNDNIKRPLKSFSYDGYMNEKSLERINVFSQPSLHNPKKITGISKYLERCFYTMNVQISNTRLPTGNRKFNYKLKPYECVPGICVPGECNPYECQKAIMRRLMRYGHKGSGTHFDNKSMSSYTTQTGSGSRSTQFRRHVHSHSQESKLERYKTRNQSELKHKQAIRVGSTFSFDVEFSKKYLKSPAKGYRENDSIRYYKAPVRRTYSTRSKGDQGRRGRYGKDRQLQSTSSLVHRASNYAPRMKRCFCTLKLQKKGRIHRENAKLNVLPTIKSPSISSRSIKIGTGNTKYQNIPKRHMYFLEQNECDPGICIPGQCNPYECLEKMKNRKDFGVSTSTYGEKSISSMTSDGRYAKKKLQTHGVDVRHKKIHKKDMRKGKDNNSISSSVSEHRSRQAVRIGSNFSFNIEFSKDTPQAPHIKEIDNEEKSTKAYRSDIKEGRRTKHLKASFSQSSRAVSHRDTQAETPMNQISTMTTSFIKRCFCTAKLKGINIPQNQNTSTFKQKCFCLLGLRNKQKNDNQHREIYSKTADKRTNTNYRHKKHFPPLEPYECEPGICIPGQCDPYSCDKIIQQRLAKQYSKSSETELIRTQSVSSNFGYGKRHKDGTTQARAKKYNKQKQYVSEDRSLVKKYTNNANKRLVRIGSNFSFNVEFYKENMDGSKTQQEVREIKTHSNRNDPYSTKTKIKHLKSTGTVGPSIRTSKSQIDKKEKRTFGVNPLLKRCFCTLKLLKRPIDQTQNIIKIDPKIVTMKTAETQSHKMLEGPPLRYDFRGEALLPYECEPFVCIPGECNPEECLERIKRRNQNTKDFGTVTGYPHRKSIGSVATRTTRDEYLQAKYRGTRPNKTTQKTNYVEKPRHLESANRSRQAVRIGSNFSFNIEFFKGNENNGPETVTTPSREYLNMKASQKTPRKYHRKSQPSYFSRSVYSQVSTKMRSTDTGMSHLKRCFCTLQLQNKNKNKLNKPKSEHSAVGEFLKKCMCVLKINKVGKLQQKPPAPAVKYEIKGTSTYSQSPRQNIKPVRILEPYECEPNFCIPGECDPFECLKRIQKRQVRDFGTDYKRNVRNFATDSIKGPFTRNMEAQFHRKQRLHSQGSSFPSKRRRRNNDTSQYASQYYKRDNTNKQAVRIGSNFSFNIEFFKEKGGQPHSEYKKLKAEKVPKIRTRSEKLRAKSRGSDSIGTNLRCQSSQCPFLKRHVMSSTANTMPKRCFCTLKLLKNLKSDFKPSPPIYHLPPTKTTDDKMTATKNNYTMPHELGVYECPPLMCIPGECDPYDCLDKMKRRGRKFRNVGTRTRKSSVASVGNRNSKIKAHGNQSIVRKRNFVAYTPHSEPQSIIFKSPENTQNMDRHKKRAVRIGSNFNFSIDFFKERSHPAIIRSPKIVRARDKDEDLKSYLSKNVTANTGKFRHHDSQVGGTITRDQASDAGNMLKRCFCTLQLQKSRQRKLLHNNMVPPGINVHYPQTVTVERVSVEPFNKKILKSQRVYSQNQSSQVRRTKSTDTKLINNLRTVSTKIDKKLLRNKEFLQSECDPNSCPNYQKRNSLNRRTINDMLTILPYTPSKFNKKESKTLVSDKKKIQKLHNLNQITFGNDNKPRDTLTFDKGKRLTAKKSRNSIPPNNLDTKSYLNNSLLCRCARIFSKRTGTKIKAHDNHDNIDNLRNERIKIVVKPNKSKSIKFAKTTADKACPVLCSKNIDGLKKKKPILQGGDVQSNIMKRESTKTEMLNDIESKSVEPKSISKNKKMKVTFADSIQYPPSMTKEKKKKFQHHEYNKVSKLCYSCSVNNCPLLSENIKTNKEKPGVFHKLTNRLTKTYDKPVTYSESADNCQYCQLCKKKLDVDEIRKGAGDRGFTEKMEKKSLSQKKIHSDYAGKRVSVSSQHRGRAATCPCGQNKPLLEMRVDSVNYNILNKREVLQRVNNKDQEENEPPSQQKHGDSCFCCKCIKKRLTEGAKISVPAKGISKFTGAPGKTFAKKGPAKKKNEPCICGSKKCAIESHKTKSKSRTHYQYKPCVCGSDICARETKKIKKLREQYICTCQDEMDKRRAERKVYDKQELLRRLLIEKGKDEIRRIKRIKRNAHLERQVKKYKDASDIMLAVDSLIDVGKLGISTIDGALRTTVKAIMDPKLTLERMKCKKTTPEFALHQLEKRYMESDAAATAKRLKLRCLFMKNVQAAKQKLEENPISHFILHATDKNAKTRKFKRKPVRRRREPLDFECSLYMASLRKRPCLSIYYKWPWFYPHLVTMLNIWKQFTDVMLFLLAAVVWSPCILCMEGCRAMMCCFFCTG